EPTKPQLAANLPSAVAGLRATFQAARIARDARAAIPATDPFLRAVADAGTARKPLRVTAPGGADVQAALGLAREFDLRLILVDPAVPSPDQLAAWKANVDGVVLNPGIRPGGTAEATDAEPTAAAAPGRQGGRRRP